MKYLILILILLIPCLGYSQELNEQQYNQLITDQLISVLNIRNDADWSNIIPTNIEIPDTLHTQSRIQRYLQDWNNEFKLAFVQKARTVVSDRYQALHNVGEDGMPIRRGDSDRYGNMNDEQFRNYLIHTSTLYATGVANVLFENLDSSYRLARPCRNWYEVRLAYGSRGIGWCTPTDSQTQRYNDWVELHSVYIRFY